MTQTPAQAEALRLFQEGREAFANHDYEDARDAFKGALKALPGDPAILIQLGRTAMRLRDTETALDYLNKAASPPAAPAEAHYERAQVLTALGRPDEARTDADKAVALKPGYGRAWHLVARLADADEAERLLMPISSAFAENKTDAIFLDYAKGRLLDKAGQYKQAFNAFSAANQKEYADSGEGTEALRAFYSDLKQNFRGKGPMAGKNADTPRPIFITGLPRSGTTLIEQILASHSKVTGLGELMTLPVTVTRRINRMTGKPLAPGAAELNTEQLSELGGLYRSEVRKLAPNAGIITDKLPQNYQMIGLIRKILPDARVLHITRRPLDVGWSIFTHPFGQSVKHFTDLAEIGRTIRLHDSLMDHWRETMPNVFMDISYETLVENFEPTVRKMLDYCGLDFEGTCLNFAGTDRAITTHSGTQVREPLFREGVGRADPYKGRLTPLKDAMENRDQSGS